MSRIKTIRYPNGAYPYYVEVFNKKDGVWEAQVRYYEFEQDEKDYENVEGLRKFKRLKPQDE